MNEFIEYFRDFNYTTICVRIILAILVGGVIGNERGKHGSAAGLRTHILVCLGSTMTSLTGYFVYHTLGIPGDVLRLAAQVVSGIGFLGAGMIIVKRGNIITGLTTAAGMWVTAAIGISLGYGFYSGALIAMTACVFTSAFLTRLEQKRKRSARVYVEVDVVHVGNVVEKVRKDIDPESLIESIPPKSNVPNSIGVYVTISNRRVAEMIKKEISELDGVRFIILE